MSEYNFTSKKAARTSSTMTRPLWLSPRHCSTVSQTAIMLEVQRRQFKPQNDHSLGGNEWESEG
ncbi:hypothetical protein ACVBEG_27725 [Pseudomonas sp. GG8]